MFKSLEGGNRAPGVVFRRTVLAGFTLWGTQKQVSRAGPETTGSSGGKESPTQIGVERTRSSFTSNFFRIQFYKQA